MSCTKFYTFVVKMQHTPSKPTLYKNKELIFLGDAICYHRKLRKKSHKEMAQILQIGRGTYAAKEKFNRFTPEEIEKCCEALNLRITVSIRECN